MAIDEATRHRVYGRLEEVLGEEVATTLMANLAPIEWADVATKQDLEALELRLEAKLEAKLSSMTRTLVIASTGQMIAFAGIAFGAARLV